MMLVKEMRIVKVGLAVMRGREEGRRYRQRRPWRRRPSSQNSTVVEEAAAREEQPYPRIVLI
jgi:hypothetical protein